MDAGPFMRLPAPSLAGDRLSPQQLELAIRHGIGSSGDPLIIMPSDAYVGMADDDLAALTGYIESLPAVDATSIERSVGPIGRAVAAFQAPVFQPARRVDHPTVHAATSDGAASRFGGLCSMCHGADYGGQVFTAEQAYWAPNLTSHSTGAGSWTLDQFGTALRQGRTPDGRTLDPSEMPWRGFSKLTDAEVEDLWVFLRALPPVDRPRPAEFAIQE
jgi:cytochrome c5